MSRYVDPLPDDTAPCAGCGPDECVCDARVMCPGCSRPLWASELCECDDEPFCGRCHEDWHVDDRRAA